MKPVSGVHPILRLGGLSDDASCRNLDLQTRRIMEAFFRMLGWQGVVPAPNVEVQHEHWRTLLEAKQNRIVISLETGLDVIAVDRMLQMLLRLAVPDATGGLPIRVFHIGHVFYVSCTLPLNASAHQMLRVHRILLRLLDACRAPG